MSGLQKTPVSWPITGSIATKNAPIMLAPGSNLVLDNVRQERLNEWRTRAGNSQNALDDLPGANVPVIAAEAPWGGLVGLCRQVDNATAGRVYTPAVVPRWMSPKVTFNVSGNAQQCAQTTPGIWARQAISPALTFVSQCSSAEGGGYRLAAWWSRSGNQGIQVSLTDAAGMSLLASSMFGNFTTAMRPRCVYSSVANMLILVWAASAGGVVSCARWSTTTGLQVGGVTTLSTNGRVGSDLFLDAIYYGGATITIAFRDNVATGGLRIVEYNPATDTPTEYTPGQDASGCLSLGQDPDASGTRYVAVTSAVPEVRVLQLNAVGVIQTNHLADTVDAQNIALVAYQATTGTPGWMIVYHGGSTSQLCAVKRRNGTISAVANLTPAGWGQFAQLASNGWREPGTDTMRYVAYVTGTLDPQPTFLEMALEFENGVSTISNQWTEPQARLLPLNAGFEFVERASIPQVQRTGVDRFVTCLPRISGFDVSPGQNATRYTMDAWSVQYMNATTYTGQNQGGGQRTQQCAYLPVGSLLQTATGQLLCSHGASALPFRPVLTPGNGAGLLTPGQAYAYVITTTLYDELGNAWDSDRIGQAVASAAAMAGNNQISVVAEATPFENTARLRTVKWWRTKGNGSQLFLVHEVTDTIANTTSITWLDQVGDNVLAQPISSELQGTITPAFSHIAEFGGRLYGIERDFPTRVRYSKPIQQGLSPQFPSEFVKDTDDGLGPATGLAALDDRLVLMKGRATYVSSGAQKDNAGNGSDPVFVRISSEDGCVAGGPFLSTGAEVYMTSSGGVKRVSRSQEIDFVGAAIDQYLSMPLVTSPETVTGLVLSPAKNEVRVQTTHFRFVHDRIFNVWERDTGGFLAGTIVMTKMLGGATQCFLTSDGHMWIEAADSTTPADAGTAYQGIIRSPWIRPTGVGGWLRLYRARLEGTVTTLGTLGPSTFTIFFDDDDTISENFTHSGAVAAGLLRAEARPVRQKCSSFSLQLALPAGDASFRLEEWWTIVAPKMGSPPSSYLYPGLVAAANASRWTPVPAACWVSRLHTAIPGTMALWQLQGDFSDSGGYGLDFSSINRLTHAPQAAPAFIPIADKTNGVVVNDPCVVGLDMSDDGTGPMLVAPLTAFLQLVGPMTIEWVMVQKQTNTTTYFCCDVLGTSGGGPSKIGQLYAMWSDSGNPAISDKAIGSNLPSPGYGDFPGYNDHTLGNWSGQGLPLPGDYHPYHFAYVRDGAGNWQVYRKGIIAGAGVLSAGANVASGTERFILGGVQHDAGSGFGGVVASVRVLNYARSQADIAADAARTGF